MNFYSPFIPVPPLSILNQCSHNMFSRMPSVKLIFLSSSLIHKSLKVAFFPNLDNARQTKGPTPFHQSHYNSMENKMHFLALFCKINTGIDEKTTIPKYLLFLDMALISVSNS